MNRAERERIVRAALGSARARAGWMRARCPFCEGRDDSFSFHPETTYYHCFRCAKKGYLEKQEGQEEFVIPKQSEDEQARELRALTNPPDGFFLLAGDTSESLGEARDYMHSRGIPESVWHEAQVGACAFGPYAGRVVIPNLMQDGSWYGYTTRAYSKAVPKKLAYKYPRGSWRGSVLHNQPALYEATEEILYVVEGAFDALFLWPHAVAVLGMPSEKQVQLLASSARPMAVVLDADAWQKGLALSLRLRLEGCRAGCVKLLDGADPDEVDRGDLWEWARDSLAG